MEHTIQELHELQSLPLSDKIEMTKERIKAWVDYFGEDGVYVSFSGGKDSTVLVDIVDEMGYNVPLVFVDTGLEYPEIREFVKSYGDRVTWIKPRMTFRQVIEKYGYPFISKEVAECVQGARKYLTSIIEEQQSLDRQTDRQTDRQLPYAQFYRKVCGSGEYAKSERGGTTESIVNFEELANLLNDRMVHRKGGANQRLAIMLGMLTRDTKDPIKANIPSKDRSLFSQERYKFFLEAPFEISNKCCNVMKKNPAHRYTKETGRKPMTAQTASESRLRTQKWLKNGCNGFDMEFPISNPMAFWVDQDVLLYIKTKNLPICPVYGEIVEDWENTNDVKGQLTISDLAGCEDMEIFDAKRPPLKTTMCDRTGCLMCMFGCVAEKHSRLQRLHQTHPKIYEYMMKPWEEGGLNYKEIIDWINAHGDMNIKY